MEVFPIRFSRVLTATAMWDGPVLISFRYKLRIGINKYVTLGNYLLR